MRRVVFVLIVFLLALAARPSLAGEDDAEFRKLAPFQGVRWAGDVPHVLVEGSWSELTAIDGVRTEKIVAFAREKHGERWRKRFGEDLVQVLTEMGKPPGDAVALRLRDPETGGERTLDEVAMTKENRRAVLEAGRRALDGRNRQHAPGVPDRWKALVRRIEGGDTKRLSAAEAAEDLDQLEAWIESRYSYANRKGVDWRGALDAVRAALGDGISRGAFALQVMRVLALFGDGHTKVDDAPERLLPPGFLPFLVEPVGDRLVAFREDRSGLLDEARPYVVALDGVATERWLDVARSVTAAASPAFVRRNAARMLRHVGWIRKELDLPAREELDVALADEKGGKPRTLRLRVTARKPTYGDWPRTKTQRLPDGTGYLRIADMDDDEGFLRGVLEALDGFRDVPRLVIDVRGNGGGWRHLLRRMLPRFLAPGTTRVVNVAAYRRAPSDPRDAPEGYLDDRFLWPLGASVWTPESRNAIEGLARTFRPAWEPDPKLFSDWHYMAIEAADGPAYARPVAVLLDEACFSATDVFLGAFQGMPGVTLVGTPSGGGSGRAKGMELAHSRLNVRMSTMASFRPDGRPYDGESIEPDVLVEPTPLWWVGREDPVLDEALRLLRRAK